MLDHGNLYLNGGLRKSVFEWVRRKELLEVPPTGIDSFHRILSIYLQLNLPIPRLICLLFVWQNNGFLRSTQPIFGNIWRVPGRSYFTGSVWPFWLGYLHDLGHKISHGFCCLVLDLAGGVGVGAEGEACIVVAQHTADRFHVYAVLEGDRGEGVAEAVQRDVFQVGILEDLLVELRYGVRVVHLSGGRRWEHVLVIRVFVVFLDQEVYGFLRDGDPADGGFGLGAGEGQFSAGVADILLADEDCAVFYIQVRPEESDQFAFAKTADQCQIKHGEETSGVGGVQVGFHIFWMERLSLERLDLWCDAVIGGIAGNQALLDCSLESAVEHEVDTADGGAAQTGGLILPNVDTAIFHQVLVKFLEVAGGQLGEFDLADAGDGVGFDHQLIAVSGGEADVGFGVEVVPGAEPGGYGIFLGSDYIQILVFLQDFGQLGLDLGLGFAEDIFDDALASDRIVAGGVAALPATVAPLADISFAVSAAFCHGASTPFFGSYNTYHNLAEKATLIFVFCDPKSEGCYMDRDGPWYSS